MNKTIFFDMDGTLFDLYGVDGWLDALLSHDPSPYEQASVMLNMSLLARYLNRLQTIGYKLGVISWLAKDSVTSYDEAVRAAKLSSLRQHLPSVEWNYVYIVEYGTPKENFMATEDDILFDDEQANRDNWRGDAYEPADIIRVLKELMEE